MDGGEFEIIKKQRQNSSLPALSTRTVKNTRASTSMIETRNHYDALTSKTSHPADEAPHSKEHAPTAEKTKIAIYHKTDG